ncbi:trigger factor [Anaerobacterium chartisolvens]|uniref:Trigger factor n=1 Tax=Anaerobacterium chartisolvens TaxID=1297424 RepID=A0A369AWK0_9FIRM|nr:trigger factor [Anaerobacterium chartisolvens]RCX13541.1 trigger factor [Anaerobacterium chartisolvens]
MNVKVENVEKNVVQLDIEVDAAKFESGMQKSFLKNAGRFSIPGFRKGKAPRKMIERYYGEQVLYEDAINFICPEAYDEAVAQNGIFPVDRPEIDIKQIGEGQNLIFTAKVAVKPEVEIGEYKGIEVGKIEVHITDEDVENELAKIAEKNARMVSVEDRPIQNGDTATINFEGFVDEEAFEGGKGEDYPLVIGSGQFIPGFEEQLVGLEAGAHAEVNVSFPEDYQSAELAGKAAVFKVDIKEIKLKELPALDDEFAKDVSEFDTLSEYKASLREKLTHEAKHKAEHETEDAIVNKVVENAVVDIPRPMIEKRIDSMIYDFDMRLRYQGLDMERYMQMMGMDSDTFRQQFSKRAEGEVKSQLVIEKIGAIEGIATGEEEVDEEIKKMAEGYKQSEEEFKKHLGQDDIEYIKRNLVMKKTVDFLVENAKIV